VSKERITITLAGSILEKIDKLIDKKTIRNRSHAIESILSNHILSKVTKVVILAAGKGMNLRPFTYELPKSILPIQDKPLLAHTIESLAQTGLKDILIVTGHLGNKIKESGTAQAIKSIQQEIGNEPFLLIYGDVLAEIDWLSLIDFHESQSASVTMAVTTVHNPDSWGMVKMKGNTIVAIEEKSDSATNSHMINSGVFVVSPEAVSMIQPSTESFEQDILPKLIKGQTLFGYHFSGKWFDIGSADDYEKALQDW